MNFKLPEKVNNIINLLKADGYEAYAVGGCVRDMVMGIEPHDFDITTSALPEETEKVFANFRLVETGIKHGTVTVISEHEPFEITTYRIDGDYLDNRHPESVSFSRNLKDDLSRRDFTVNTLCFNETDGIVDLFGGTEDIKKGIIRCVGDPEKRFSEDALRIMRALRFSATLGFSIEKETARCIHSQKDLLKNIAAERIRDEFTRLITGKNAMSVLREYHDVIEVFIPEFAALFGCEQNTPFHIYDVAEHTLHALDSAENDRVLKITMLFHDIGKPLAKTTDINGIDHFKGHATIGAKMCVDILKRLRYDNKTVERVSTLVAIHSECCPKTKAEAKLMLCEVGEEYYRNFMRVRRADCLAKADPHSPDKELKKMQALLDEITENNECYSLKELKINGNDIKALGVTDGKAINRILQKLLFEVIRDNKKNSKSRLIARAKTLSEESE